MEVVFKVFEIFFFYLFGLHCYIIKVCCLSQLELLFLYILPTSLASGDVYHDWIVLNSELSHCILQDIEYCSREVE